MGDARQKKGLPSASLYLSLSLSLFDGSHPLPVRKKILSPQFLFVVMSNVSDETLMFKAATAEERDMWVNELETVIGGGSGAGSDDGAAAGGAAAADAGKDGAEAVADEPVAGDEAGADGPSGASGSGGRIIFVLGSWCVFQIVVCFFFVFFFFLVFS